MEYIHRSDMEVEPGEIAEAYSKYRGRFHAVARTDAGPALASHWYGVVNATEYIVGLLRDEKAKKAKKGTP